MRLVLLHVWEKLTANLNQRGEHANLSAILKKAVASQKEKRGKGRQERTSPPRRCDPMLSFTVPRILPRLLPRLLPKALTIWVTHDGQGRTHLYFESDRAKLLAPRTVTRTHDVSRATSDSCHLIRRKVSQDSPCSLSLFGLLNKGSTQPLL